MEDLTKIFVENGPTPTFYNRARKFLSRRVKRLGPSAGDAVGDRDGLLQEVLNTFYRRVVVQNRHTIIKTKGVSIEIYRLLKNKLHYYTRYRRQLKRDERRTVGFDIVTDRPSLGSSPAEEASGEELDEKFKSVLSSQDFVIYSMVREGHNHKEIADFLGVKKGVVTRSIEKIKVVLKRLTNG